MKCLFSACQVTISGPSQQFIEGEQESITKLRDAIIDAFMSIVHGMQGVAPPGSPHEKQLHNYAIDILHYIDALLSQPNLQTNDEFVRNVYELYIDITEYYGDALRSNMRQLTGPSILRDGLTNFQHIQGM